MLINEMKFKEFTLKLIRIDIIFESTKNHLGNFQPSWFQLFPTWLKCSPDKDASFCLPFFLFNKSFGHYMQ
jgi:hypothetical protein